MILPTFLVLASVVLSLSMAVRANDPKVTEVIILMISINVI